MADFWRTGELQALSPSVRGIAEELIQYGIKRNYAKNSVIIAQGSEIREILFVVTGTASSHTIMCSGSEIWGSDFCAGDFIGHVALLGQRPCRFEIRADKHLTALSIPAMRFKSILDTEAKICAHAARDISNRLYHMSERMLELSSLSAPARVCAELLRMARPIGIEEGKMIIRPGPVFTRLAKRVNSTRETVSRTVADLQRANLVSREPGALRIENPKAVSSKFD